MVAQNPFLQGTGIDEDTALAVELGVGFHVIGQGSVTIVDAREAVSNVADLRDGQVSELLGVRLHLLPAGSCYRRETAPETLRGFMHIVTEQAS